jgi:serine/threonine protein kinase/TolB-like protein/tetratricopeptide (TPR) repeat protein
MSADEPTARLTPERWREVETIFLAARDRLSGARSTFLDQACGVDVALRLEVESLLAADLGATGFLESPGALTPLMPEFEATVRVRLADHYTLERELGRGGMATVYLANDLRHHRQVAIKVLNPELGAVLGAERFLREIGIAARLSHPHILPLHESGTLDLGLGRPVLFYVMPYIAGQSLRERLREELQLPLDEALGIARQVADALDHAHREGVIHRDIKPENILLSDGQAVLADFGIARALDAAGGDKLTDAGLTIGTPAYMSPEQASGSVRLDGRSDIYALGCVVYEILGGQPPFPGPTPQSILARHAMDPVPSLRTLRPAVSGALARVVSRALAKVPSDRFPTARAFADALAAASLVEDPPPLSAWRRRRGLLAVVASLALVGVLVGVIARRSHRTDAGQPPAVATVQEERSIAVLPLVNLTVGRENEFLSDALTDELIDQLSRVEGLRVAARASAFTFKGKSPDPREVGDKLHVATVLDGSVQVSGNKVRVTVELVSARDGRRVWFDTYDRFLTDVLTVQSQIARSITGPLELRFITSTGTPVTTGVSKDEEAHKLYLRGRQYSYSFDRSDRQLAVEYFRKAVERDSNYALAWAGLADAYDLRTYALEPREVQVVREQARAAALRAVALDSTLAEAYVALGDIQASLDWDWGPAERTLRRAIALNSNNALAHRWYADLLVTVGRYSEAVAEAEHAERLDPLNPFMVLGTIWASTSARQFERGAAAARRWIELDPSSEHGYTTLGRMQFFQGKQREAFVNLERGAKLEKGQPYSVNALRLAWAYAASGQHEKARSILRDVHREPGRAWPPSTMFAAVYAALGDADSAFDWLERAYAAHENEIQTIAAIPELDPLRGDPRFTSLRRRMRLP